ncbi:hypothetical protein BOTCAL_0349g00010 [Botryotinia calthae]|uniref:Uncharacterized protein n=1 Tax=Botryotinia calthae TaxID=38488 RepID=A0A4Y8CSJ7_9HELO|nr:hypothetical protein BOTCAL_0349g00010 [Botryotinia calthae]
MLFKYNSEVKVYFTSIKYSESLHLLFTTSHRFQSQKQSSQLLERERKLHSIRHRPHILQIPIPLQHYPIPRPDMKKPSLLSTSHHSKIIPDRTRRAPPRADTESSYGDGNISDSSTRPILSSKNKSAKSSEKSKDKEYAPAIRSEIRIVYINNIYIF